MGTLGVISNWTVKAVEVWRFVQGRPWPAVAAVVALVVAGIPAYGAPVKEDPGGWGYRTSIHSEPPAAARELPVAVVGGTPYQMGYHYGELMSAEINVFVPIFYSYAMSEAGAEALDAAWNASAPHTDPRFEAEMHGVADGSGLAFEVLRRVHSVMLLDSYSCSSIAAWGSATLDGHLYQTRNLDWDLEAGAHDYSVLVVYVPESGLAHVSPTFAGVVGAHTGMNTAGIALAEMGDSPGSEMPYDLNGTHFMPLFRAILYDADSLTEALEILTTAQRIKRYHYVFGDGGAELAAVKIRAHAPETPPNDLIVWTDNDPTDEYAAGVYGGPDYRDVLEDVVYNDEERLADPDPASDPDPTELGFTDLQSWAQQGLLDKDKMIRLANAIPIVRGNVMNVLYDATALKLWVAAAQGTSPAFTQPYIAFDLLALDYDEDGMGDVSEGSCDSDLDGTPDCRDTDSDDDGFWDYIEYRAGSGAADAGSVPAPGVPGDLDRDGAANAVDVQLVINGALARSTPCPVDCNADQQVTAMDVQLVINAVLGRG